ncbi:hypothetical protein [Nonomuraea maheshkhaliensis]|uniref:hypothetical protein n=1 Tax=Nonomuraea maheshkhaliensis TaxID=419590 RepID=UPI0031F9E809
MHHRPRTWVLRRLRSLTWLELLNIPLQAVIWFGSVGFPVTVANSVGFALFALLLLEGAGYWFAKHRQIATHDKSLPGAGAFAVARRGNVAALVVGLLFIAWAVVNEAGQAWGSDCSRCWSM